MVVFGYSSGFVLLVAIAIIVGYKFYHEHGNMNPAAPGSTGNAVNPNTSGAMSLKY
jgi:hypothetical protein